jgi:hypothetical protein
MELKALLWNYRTEIVKAVLTLLTGWLLTRLTNKSAHLIAYLSHLQTVNFPAQGQAPGVVVQTFSLFLWNQGKASAKDVQVLHNILPAHNVYPDLPRNTIQTPGGGTAIHFPSIPPKVLVTISYLVFLPVNQQIISAVTYEHGPAHFIPVNLQRVFPKPVQYALAFLVICGAYTVIGWLWTLLTFLVH